MILQVRCHKTLKIKAIKKGGLQLDGAIVKCPVTFLKAEDFLISNVINLQVKLLE
jgi:hypothetical protein